MGLDYSRCYAKSGRTVVYHGRFCMVYKWAALGRVCRQWRYCINILIATLPVKITNSAFYRTIRVGARCYLELALLSNYPYRIHALSNYPYSIHALSNVNSGSHQTISILAHILHQGCGINIFQLPVLNYSMQTFLKFLGMYPYGYKPSRIHAAVEDHTGDLFLFVSRNNTTVPLDLSDLRKMESVLRTNDGRPVFVWYTYSMVNSGDYTEMHKRNFRTASFDAEAYVFIFRNRDPDVNAGREFDHRKRKVAKKLCKAVAKKRSRPDRNTEEKRLIRIRLAQGAEEESIPSDE